MLNAPHIESLEALQRLVNGHYCAYLASKEHWVVRDVLRRWKTAGWDPIVFGGALRDFVLFGSDANPKDIDVVVRNKTLRELRFELAQHVVRETRFGGLQIDFNGTRFDIWPLYRTWAFKNSDLSVTPENLTKTTFLNIEAIAALPSPEGDRFTVSESGFINAMNTRKLDINLGNNPFPQLAAVRAIITARRLRFGMTSRLLEYIVRVIQADGFSALMSAQKSHYGSVVIAQNEMENYLRYDLGANLPNRTQVYLKH